jgi:hypothetical protein
MLLYLAIAVAHTLLAAIAGVLLWKTWRRFAARDATVGLIVGGGLLVRAVSAQVLFWVSYAHLPAARSLQDGDGFWKFAIDAEAYFGYSRAILSSGWRALVFVDRSLPSPVYLQVLAFFILLFGAVTMVGVLLNLGAYLVGCEAILRLGDREGEVRRPTLIALAALSFSPSLVLWSTQPLKDVFFVSAVAAFVAACSYWRTLWTAEDPRPLRLGAALALMFLVVYAIAGVRWYFALILCAAAFPFLLTTVLASRRRLAAGMVNAAVFLLLPQVVAIGSGPYLPDPIVRLLSTFHPSEIGRDTRDIAGVLVRAREAFDATAGNSQIRGGTADQEPASSPEEMVPATVDPAASASSAASVSSTSPTSPTAPRPIAGVAPAANARAAPANVRIGSAKTRTASKRTPSVRAAGRAGSETRVPRSAIGRIAAGTAAVTIPRFLAEALGLIHVGGGSGLWPIVDVDTLLFDVLLFIVVFYVVRGISGGALRNPSFWLVALTTCGIDVLLTYTISNFGTLFRHRSMILVGLCLLLTVTQATPRRIATPDPVT